MISKPNTPAKQVSLGRKATSGAAMIGTAQGIRVLLTLVSTIVLARLISPDEYGIVAMGAPITGFILLFQDIGLSQATIQAREISDAQSNGLFWLNMGASMAVVVAMLAVSPLVAWFYREPRAGYFVAASSLTVLVTGSELQHSALLQRELRFATVSLRQVLASVVTFGVTIIAAVLLHDFWALWIGTFVGACAGAALIWTASPWRPHLSVSFRGCGSMARFGSALAGFNLINFVARNADNVLIAKVSGAAAVGLYDRSYKLMMFPLQNINAPISSVVLPILRRVRDEPERYRRSYLIAVQGILMLSIPGIVVASATSYQLAPFLLGKEWVASGPIFFWLSLAGFLQPLGNPTGWLFISGNRGGSFFRWGIVSTVVTVAGFAVGIHWGPVGVAASYFVTTVLKMPLQIWWAVSGTPVRATDFYRIALPSTLAGVIVTTGIHYARSNVNFIVLLLSSMILSYLISFLCHWIDPVGRRTINAIAKASVLPIMHKISLRLKRVA